MQKSHAAPPVGAATVAPDDDEDSGTNDDRLPGGCGGGMPIRLDALGSDGVRRARTYTAVLGGGGAKHRCPDMSKGRNKNVQGEKRVPATYLVGGLV